MDEPDLFKDAGYSLEEPLEEDEWGVLYRATYIPHHREVLVRAFPPEFALEPGAWELMQAEIGAWARLDHPGVLQVLDWGESAGRCYVATSLPAGRPLGELINDESGLDGADELFCGLLVSVEAARQWGVLHLGLAPSNIWVASDGSVQIGEFGFWYVSCEFPALELRSGRLAAPEQRGGGRVSAATDVYSLGLLYIALRCGMGAASRVSRGEALPDGLAGRLQVVGRCLEREPLARYRSGRELAEAFGCVPDEWLYEEYRDCPLCKLKAELEREASGRSWSIPSSGRPGEETWASYVWVLVIALAVATAIVWWLALR